MAYQGKFSQPRNTEENIRAKAAARKREAAAKQSEPVRKAEPVKKVDAVQETAPVKQEAPVKKAPPVREEAPVKEAPAVKEETPSPKAAPPKKSAPKTEAAPAKKSGKKKKKKVKKANRNVTIVFYTLYFVMIAAFLAGMLFLNNWLNDFLVTYQASQPTTRCEEVFREHFAAPDWNELYTMAGLSDTAYEGADAFTAFMEKKAAGQELTYVETSAGLSGGHKYLLKLGNETIGYFTLKDNAPEGAELPDWQLDQVALTAAYSNTVLVQTAKGHSVSINGVMLDESHIIQVATTLADRYLPQGVSAPTTCIYQLEGLMTEPEILVTDPEGNEFSVIYDEASGMYIEQTDANTIGAEEEEAALTAGEVYAKYMIEEASYGQLAKSFDSTSQIFKTITSMTLWMQGHDGYEFASEEVSEYCRYSDKYFSARVSLTLNVTRRDGTVKEYTVDSTMFFALNGSKWKVYDMTNVDVSDPIAEVRLTFKLDDHVVFTNMFENDIQSFKAPTVTAPEGKVFAGWYRLETAADGSAAYTLVFSPDEDGTVTLSPGTVLEPMTLHALFENAN